MWRNLKLLYMWRNFRFCHISHINLKFFHMTNFSPQISFVIFATNMRYDLGQKLVFNTWGAQSLLFNWLSGNFFTKLNLGSCTEVTDLTSSGSCFVHNGSNEALGSPLPSISDTGSDSIPPKKRQIPGNGNARDTPSQPHAVTAGKICD